MFLKFKILLSLLLVVLLASYLYNLNKVKVVFEFDKFRPVSEKVDIFYNGYKIGRSTRILPCPSSKGTCVYALLKKDAMFLPQNITAKMKQKIEHEKKYKDYVELIYPDVPSHIRLEDDDTIKGKLAGGFHNYLSEEVEYSEMEQIKLAFLNTADNLEKSTSVLLNILYSIEEITKNAENETKDSAKNLNQTLKNLNSMTGKINNSIKEELLNNLFLNTDETMLNINSSTYYLKSFTDDLSSANSSSYVNSIAKNVDDIVRGVNCTLRKKFGGLRLLFGRTIK